MTRRASLGLLVIAVTLSACKDKPGVDSAAASQVLAQSEEVTREEDELLKRRDSLLLNRKEIREKRAELADRRREIREAGGDTAEVDREVDALLEQEKQLVEQEVELNQKYEQILTQRREMMASLAAASGGAGDQSAQVAVREQGIAGREKELARREDRVAQREAQLADRERALALREKETCGVAVQPATIIQTVDAKGSKYTKKDVDPILRRARSNMSRKGVLASDLPAPAQGLEKEATRAMAEADYGRARFAATQLLSTVDSIRIDKTFIQAKIARLNGLIRGKTLDDGARTEVETLFREATANYGDGKYTDANKRLNKIYAMLQ